MRRQAIHAVRAVVRPEPLVPETYDYADSFEIEIPVTDTRTPEQLFRAALDRPVAAGLRWAIPLLHRRLLLLRVKSIAAPNHILGWSIMTSEIDVLQLQAVGPLMNATIIGRRFNSGRIGFTTFVYYNRGGFTRAIWTVVSPLHRAVAPFLLALGASTSPAGAPRDARREVH